jgi:hypothetical protein
MTKLLLKDIVLGIDLGGTIHHKNEQKETVPMPRAFEVINALRQTVKAVYIVSRVSDLQSYQAYSWFNRFSFFEKTGLTPNKVHFCYERSDKAPICQRLCVSHFIDDRPEVMFHMDSGVTKLLMNPIEKDLIYYKDSLGIHEVVHNWNDVENHFKQYV